MEKDYSTNIRFSMGLRITSIEKHAGLTATLLLALLFSTASWATAQTQTAYTPADKFPLPESNATISFLYPGSYISATLENGSWHFVGLSNNYTQGPLDFSVSSENSDIAFYSCRKFNLTIAGASVSYRVSGPGKQTISFGENLRGGEWSVAFNGIFVGLNEGWTSPSDGTITITGGTQNVTVAYYTLPDAAQDNSANLPFYQRHSVIIATGAACAIVIVVAAAVARRNKAMLIQSSTQGEE